MSGEYNKQKFTFKNFTVKNYNHNQGGKISNFQVPITFGLEVRDDM